MSHDATYVTLMALSVDGDRTRDAMSDGDALEAQRGAAG